MSKKQLLKDNLVLFIGGNVANAASYILNIVLLKKDTLLNLYTAYTSVTLLLLIPSQITLRIFTVFGDSVLNNVKEFYSTHRNKVLFGLAGFSALLIPFSFFLSKVTNHGNLINSFLLIAIAIIGLLTSVFRGIHQHQEDYNRAVISINVEAFSRLILGLIFGVVLDMGIAGILFAHLIGMIGALLVCVRFTPQEKDLSTAEELKLKSLFFSTALLTSGLEFFSQFDITFSNYKLNPDDLDPPPPVQTEYNTLQLFRKIIFYGTFTVASMVLSMGGRGKHTRKFMFIYTLSVGAIIGIGSSIGFLILQKPMFKILGTSLEVISQAELIKFLMGTTFMSVAYLLSNWLYTLKKYIFISVPLIASGFQFMIFSIYGKDLHTLLESFLYSSAIFFGLVFIAGLYAVNQKKENY